MSKTAERVTETNAFIGTSIDVSRVEIELSDLDIHRLFETAYDGYCPVCCNNEINTGEVICCDCLRRAEGYHKFTCGCTN